MHYPDQNTNIVIPLSSFCQAKSNLCSRFQARMDLKTVGKGMMALPSLDAELEKAAADEQEKQREKVKDIFVAQVPNSSQMGVIKTM